MKTAAMRVGRGGWWRPAMWSVLAGLLLLPAAAMRFTPEVTWTASDFLFAALLLGGLGVAVELVMRFTRRPLTRATLAAGALLAVLLVWAEGAVGLV